MTTSNNSTVSYLSSNTWYNPYYEVIYDKKPKRPKKSKPYEKIDLMFKKLLEEI